ncbi:kinase-like protein [Wolfiporia cocos MD-104 SS10]|uniref:Kinase-like protein n=1 Tax=Wolfiporia cocos (strain MD-104) TaxID=742152 RepID=A0A2H3JAZ7_WOLCO|nr:kinase-like protein [Wolfiporia cocos MD-104 SS10]
MSAILGAVIDASRIGSDISGVPGIGAAASCVRAISQRCNQVVSHKKECRLLANQAAMLLQVLLTSHVEVDQLRAAADEVTLILRAVYDRLEILASYSLVRAILWDGKVTDGIRKCEADLTTALSRFHIASNITVANAQQTTTVAQANHHDEVMKTQRRTNELIMDMKQRMLTILPRDGTIAAELGRTIEPTPEQLTDAGQLVLTSRGDSEVHTTEEEYTEVQRPMSELYHQTGVTASVHILDKQVEFVGCYPMEKCANSWVWKGLWLGREKVAIKVLRKIAASPAAKDHFVHEVKIWSELRHPNILPLLGIVTDMSYIHTVSPWMENGSILQYVARNKDANKVYLLSGAAKGLAYLHEQGIAHGNVRCSNILVNDKLEGCICDFGMAKAFGEILESVPQVTETGGTRWQAPEIVFTNTGSPTPASDTWSFGMTMLECFTLLPPWQEVKRDCEIVLDMLLEGESRHPERPQETPDLTDEIWCVMMRCWKKDPAQRCSLATIVECLQDPSPAA